MELMLPVCTDQACHAAGQGPFNGLALQLHVNAGDDAAQLRVLCSSLLTHNQRAVLESVQHGRISICSPHAQMLPVVVQRSEAIEATKLPANFKPACCSLPP